MTLFQQRSTEKELLDAPAIPKEALYQNLKELHSINVLLGGYDVIYAGFKKLLASMPHRTIKVLDIGSGGGDTLRMIHRKYASAYQLSLSGVDMKQDCIAYAKSNCSALAIEFIASDYRDLLGEALNYDIITASLFCHHLSDDDIVELLKWMHQNAKEGIIINDLERHYMAYYSIKWLTRLFSSSYLVKNDAPLSVLRSFKRKELEALLQRAGIAHYSIQWKWAFRWLICIKTKQGHAL
jgi:2-polyprenyl-3-methyl-5-hydroxy-6-metoxy-1,4-benzoquinol methylase